MYPYDILTYICYNVFNPKLCMNNLLKRKNMVSNVGETLVVSRNGRGQVTP